MKNVSHFAYSTRSDSSQFNPNIDQLLLDRKSILDLPEKEFVISDDESPHIYLNPNTIPSPGKLLLISDEMDKFCKLKNSFKLSLYNGDSARKTLLLIDKNKGDTDDQFIFESLKLITERYSFKTPNYDHIIEDPFEASGYSIKGIHENNEKLSSKNDEDYKTAKSFEEDDSLIIRLENIDLFDENARLKLENKRLREESLKEINELKKQLQLIRKELSNALKKINQDKVY